MARPSGRSRSDRSRHGTDGAPPRRPSCIAAGSTSSTTTTTARSRRGTTRARGPPGGGRRAEGPNWATPLVWEHAGRAEIVTSGSDRVRSYDLTGKLLWEFKGMSSISIPTPFERHGLLFISSGYVGDALRPTYAIRPGASGDISLKAGETSNQFI